MPKMRAVQVAKAGGPLEMVEREIPEPESGVVRIKVQACGVCHSDSVTKDGLFPGIQYPRVPGHEVIGIIDAVGPNVPAMEGWSTRGRGLERRLLRLLRQLPPGKLFCLRDQHPGHRSHPRRRLRGIYGGALLGCCRGARRVVVGRSRTADVRRGHYLQLPAQQRRAPGRRGCRDRLGWTGPSGYSVRGQERIQYRRHRTRRRQRSTRQEAWCVALRR